VTDFILPPWLKTASARFQYIDATGISRGEFGGPPKTGTRGGDRLHATLDFSPTATTAAEAAQERRILISLLARLQGRQHRIYITNPARRLAGSFPATELLTNNTFANGATGWFTDANSTITAQDRMLRATVTQCDLTAIEMLYQVPTVVANVPHVLRALTLDGRGSSGVSIGPSLSLGHTSVASYGTTRGLKTATGVPSITNATQYPVVINSSSGYVAGDYVDTPWCSLSRCALVDNGANLLLQSDDFTTTWVNTRTTDAANSTTAPDGTTTADSIIEDASASTTHIIAQGVTVAATVDLDYTFTVCLKAGTRTFASLVLTESTGSHTCQYDINLSNGAVNAAVANGANWANARGFIVNMGNGWYRATLVCRKVSAGTTVTPAIYMANSLGGISYTGDGASLFYAWRATFTQSAVATRLVSTTGASAPGIVQTGNGIHIKGLPASTNGLLLPLDEVEIITSFGSELKIVTVSLNSDAAGLGYLQFTPPIRGALADNAPVIVHEPFGYFMSSGEAIGWEHMPGIVTNASAEFEEAG
jgi:hypothetical protein